MSSDGVHTDFSKAMSYGDYLDLDTLLSRRIRFLTSMNEPLFIAIHQVQELWMKLFLHELDFAMARISAKTICALPSRRWRAAGASRSSCCAPGTCLPP